MKTSWAVPGKIRNLTNAGGNQWKLRTSQLDERGNQEGRRGMIRVEREEYLRHHPQTKANGYYERDLKTAIGTIEGLKVARSRDSGFHSAFLPYRANSSVELSELIMALFAVGVCVAKSPICFSFFAHAYLCSRSFQNGCKSGAAA